MIASHQSIALLAILEQQEPSHRNALKHFLSESWKKELEKVATPAFEKALSHEEVLSRIHYSWMIPLLEQHPSRDQELIIATLKNPQRDKLKKHFKHKKSRKPTSLFSSFAHEKLFKEITQGQEGYLPLEYLPIDPLNRLLHCDFKKLTLMVDYLGLHDLAKEIKHLVKSKQIQSIQEALSAEKSKYIKELLKVGEPIGFSSMELEKWDGDAEKLHKTIHYRGLNRLAKALFPSHPGLVWHITHLLDQGRSKMLLKLKTDPKNKNAQKQLIQQVLNIEERLSRKGTT